MLTGDKLETAENIGYSCKLLNNDMDVIRCSTLEDVKREFNEETAKLNEIKMKKMIQRGILVEAGALSKPTFLP
jgi:magnesium-transporting ATPase (P-type)